VYTVRAAKKGVPLRKVVGKQLAVGLPLGTGPDRLPSSGSSR
jgi:hypothetical protein